MILERLPIKFQRISIFFQPVLITYTVDIENAPKFDIAICERVFSSKNYKQQTRELRYKKDKNKKALNLCHV